MLKIDLCKGIVLRKSSDGYSLAFSSRIGKCVLNLDHVAGGRGGIVQNAMISTLSEVFKAEAPVESNGLPAIGFKLAYGHEFISRSEFNYLSNENFAWEDDDALEVVSHQVNERGDDVAIVLNTQCNVLNTAALPADFFKPIRNNEERLHDDLVEVMTNAGVLQGDVSIASEVIDRVIESGKFRVEYK